MNQPVLGRWQQRRSAPGRRMRVLVNLLPDMLRHGAIRLPG
ncbi:hypothetical protein [Rhodoferax sp.]|nr:hypothetical protein [Rhodoferax sp.]